MTRHGRIQTPDGRTLAIYEGGELDGAPIFFLNGTPSSGLLYERHVRLAEQTGVHLVAYDRPGYGGSTALRERSVVDAASDVATIADALGIERFALWGVSGGGPHALACAARLTDRLAAVASLAAVAPYEAEGLDWLAGMGESNIHEFALAIEGREALTPYLEAEARTIIDGDPEVLVEAWSSLLTPVDAAACSGELGRYVIENVKVAVTEGVEGWLDDDLAFMKPWGFDLSEISVPVLLVHGREDRFVPFAHGEWLAARIPDVEARLTDEDGHLTLLEERIGEVHDWLRARL